MLARLVVFLGWFVQTSTASSSSSRGTGLEVSFPWELYGVGFLCVVAAIAPWEAMTWACEWCGLRRVGSVSESRGARRLRKLQQAAQEEVERYSLDDVGAEEELQTPRRPTPSRTHDSTLRYSPNVARASHEGRPSTPERSFGHSRGHRGRYPPLMVATGMPTNDWDHGFRPNPGPVIMSEQTVYIMMATVGACETPSPAGGR